MSQDVDVMLVDDHAIVREGLRVLLESMPGLNVVAEAGSGDEALSVLHRVEPHVVVVDLKMPGMACADFIRLLKLSKPSCNVIVLTSYADDDALREVIQAGAIGYLLKDVHRTELLSAIRAVARSEPWLHQALQRQVVDLIRRRGTPDPYAHLSMRERSVVRFLARGLSNREIGVELGLTEGTVKGYVSNILRKLGLAQRAQAVLFISRNPLREGFSDSQV